MIKTKYWTYKPKIIPSYVYEPLLKLIRLYIISDKKRKSCVFYNINPNKTKEKIYNNMMEYEWKDAPSLLHKIYDLIIQYTKEYYDYVLVHIYESGKASIGYHNDSEALNSSIASVSLGATRKFRMKKIGRNEGWDYEINLNDGDLIWMHGPTKDQVSCQKIYLHCVPIEKKVKDCRINLTFRQYE